MKNSVLCYISLWIWLLAGAVRAEAPWVRVACTQGPDLDHYGLKAFEKALDFAGRNTADLVLLPEYMNGEMVTEPMAGPSARLMSREASTYHMYVAGTIARRDETTSRIANTALLFDRDGQLIGTYDKIHLYGAELDGGLMTPGTSVPVFQTDFGRVGFVTCNDIAFADVATSATVQGANLLLFPNLGYSALVARTRAVENKTPLIASSRSGPHNFWDGTGTDVMTTATRDKMPCKDILEHRIGEMDILLATVKLKESPTQ